ncbi:unnamed protein product [Blepharisma stoltei]|uniref:RING-type E3 ubiquitin transferase n=1 Tax=Blepharisma stoltei TaxID=1481888 RepID=A0AAU9J227_9CILI|nr:unnamed protein product [Blepharisma stoltei]
MAEPMRKRIAAIAVFLLFIYVTDELFSPHNKRLRHPTTKQNSETLETYNVTIEAQEYESEALKRDYLGTWQSFSNGKALDLFDSAKGRALYKHFKDNSNHTINRFIMCDGMWESDDKYMLITKGAQFNESTQTIVSNNGIIIIPSNYKNITICEGASKIVSEKDKKEKYKMQISMKSNNCTLDLNFKLEEHTKNEQLSEALPYIILVSTTTIMLIVVFAKHTKDCFAESHAKKTSIVTLGMQAAMDFFMCIWNIRLTFDHPKCFDYFTIASILSFSLFVIIQGRLLQFVWRAQHTELLDISTETFRRNYAIFQSRFLLLVMVSVILSTIFESMFYVTIFIFHSFFIPQIIHNARYGYKNSFRKSMLYIIFICRTSIVLYVFGCPKNYFVYEPKPLYCISLVTHLTIQFLILLKQSSSGTRFFIPKALRPAAYSYYKTPEEERIIEANTDCIICMTPLNLQGKEMHDVVDFTKTMHTPCNHMFHQDCLTNWMTIKMECPTCRGTLPPLDEW